MPRQAARLLLATTSADKIREYKKILRGLPLTLVEPADIHLSIDVDESGATFRENAELKARAYWQAGGIPCLAEDSGLEIDFMGGEPGVRSARWEGRDYERKNRLIIDHLVGVKGLARRCRYVCEVAFIGPDGRLHRSRGELAGRVAEQAAGRGGFGYDPIFYLPRLRRTLAQLSPAEKHTLSHRGRAARLIRRVIERELLHA